jgi:hypothetical protein
VSLRHFYKKFKVDPDDLEDSDLMVQARSKMGEKLYGMAVRVLTEFVEKQERAIGAGYFQYAFIMGHSGKAPKGDVDYLWKRMIEKYGDDDKPINMILGTLCMIVVARDDRGWVYKDDLDKKAKKDVGQVPDANEYWIVKCEY